MPYATTNKYDAGGSGMVVGQVWQPDVDAAAARTQGFMNDMSLLKQQQQPMNARLGFDQQKWGSLFPLLQGAFNQAGQWNARVGGHSGAGPHINAAPIWNPQQVDQRVNQMRASNDATTGSQIRDTNQSLAGRGFGSNSPLAAMLGTIAQQKTMATNTGAENDLRWNAAQGNAQQQLKAQTAQEAQHAARMQEDIERRRTYQGLLSSLMGSLGQFA